MMRGGNGGNAALLLKYDTNHDGTVSRDELIRRITEYAQPMGEGRPNDQFGYGHIYAGRIELAGSGTPPTAGAGSPPPQTGSAAGTARDGNRVFQPILDIMKQSGQ